MKVFGFPDSIKRPEIDYTKFNLEELLEKEAACSAELKIHLEGLGYTGENTGKIYRIPHADGYAQYMIAEGPATFALVHLPYGDAWDSRYASKMTKKEILASVERDSKLASMFAKK